MKDPNRRGADLARRAALKNMAIAAAAAAILPSRRALGAELPRLDVKDAAASALGYVLNASQVDPKKYPQYVPGSNCENCLQLQGTAGNTYRPCGLFPGKLVSVGGWCKGWTPEM